MWLKPKASAQIDGNENKDNSSCADFIARAVF